MAVPDTHCQEEPGFGMAEVVGTDYLLAAAGFDLAAVGIAPVTDQNRIVAQMEVARGPQVD